MATATATATPTMKQPTATKPPTNGAGNGTRAGNGNGTRAVTGPLTQAGIRASGQLPVDGIRLINNCQLSGLAVDARIVDRMLVVTVSPASPGR